MGQEADQQNRSEPASPPALGRHESQGLNGQAMAFTLLAGIRAGRDNLSRLPRCVFRASSGWSERGGACKRLVCLTVAGAAQVEGGARGACPFLLPVELRHVNHAASTNETESSRLPKYLRANLPPQRESLGGQFRRLLGGNCTLSVPPLAVHCP